VGVKEELPADAVDGGRRLLYNYATRNPDA
jgi:hypothetical protein